MFCRLWLQIPYDDQFFCGYCIAGEIVNGLLMYAYMFIFNNNILLLSSVFVSSPRDCNNNNRRSTYPAAEIAEQRKHNKIHIMHIKIKTTINLTNNLQIMCTSVWVQM